MPGLKKQVALFAYDVVSPHPAAWRFLEEAEGGWKGGGVNVTAAPAPSPEAAESSSSSSNPDVATLCEGLAATVEGQQGQQQQQGQQEEVQEQQEGQETQPAIPQQPRDVPLSRVARALSPELRDLWEGWGCGEAVEIRYLEGYEAMLATALAQRPLHERIMGGEQQQQQQQKKKKQPQKQQPQQKKKNLKQQKPDVVVAVCVSTTTRSVVLTDGVGTFDDLALFRLMLPSLTRTAEVGVEYWVYICYDAGDVFFDAPGRVGEIQAVFEQIVGAPLRQRGVTARAVTLRFLNSMGRPGPAFNFMTAAAAADGAEFLFRTNDDSEFLHPWAIEGMSQLRSFDPPLLGVVGPRCKQGNTGILTHDMVHRTHLRVFPYYYPPVLMSWWLDDWITKVYGPSRTHKGPYEVHHHMSFQGTRYAANRGHKQQLPLELEAGQAALSDWVEEHVECGRGGSGSSSIRGSPATTNCRIIN